MINFLGALQVICCCIFLDKFRRSCYSYVAKIYSKAKIAVDFGKKTFVNNQQQIKRLIFWNGPFSRVLEIAPF